MTPKEFAEQSLADNRRLFDDFIALICAVALELGKEYPDMETEERYKLAAQVVSEAQP